MTPDLRFQALDKIRHFAGGEYTYLTRVPDTDFHRLTNADGMVMTLSTSELYLHYEKM